MQEGATAARCNQMDRRMIFDVRHIVAIVMQIASQHGPDFDTRFVVGGCRVTNQLNDIGKAVVFLVDPGRRVGHDNDFVVVLKFAGRGLKVAPLGHVNVIR